MVLQLKESIVCFKENSNEIVAVNLLLMRGKNEYKYSDEELMAIFHGESMLKLLNFMQYFEKNCPTVDEYFYLDKYLYAIGLGVNMRYRNRGVAAEMLKAR